MKAIALFLGITLATAEDLQVLPPAENRPAEQEMLRRHFRQRAHEALDRRLANYETLETPEQITEYQQKLKAEFIEHLGGFPERTPLEARVVGRLNGDGFRAEKVIYESRPNFPVTATLYLPLSEAPYPGVLLPCGHSDNGKAAEAYQRACMLLARNGMAVLCYDPIGQGERKQLLDHNGQGAYRSTAEHNILGVTPILLGENLATYRIWDGIRGIDYLVSRDEIDASKIGCTGNSGGGLMTSYLMALDDRIVAAAPGCFITTTRRKNERPGPGDAEQNIHAQIAFGLDHPDYLLLRAPRPTLILSATRDFVPIEGAWESYRQAKRLYTRLGYSERVDLAEADERHGFSEPLRVAMVRWMSRWLLGRDEPIVEDPVPVFSDAELQCTPDGQVLRLPNARSIFDLYAERAEQLAQSRRTVWRAASETERRAALRSVAGIRPLDNLPQPQVELVGTLERNGYRIEKLILPTEGEIALPALLFQPQDATAAPCLYLHGEGKHVDAAPGGPIEQLVRGGHPVLAVDLRGCGETRTTPWRFRNRDLLGTNVAEFYIAYMLGQSFVGLRAEDALIAARYLSDRTAAGSPSRPIHVIGIGEAGPAALHAAAVEPHLFEAVTLKRTLDSWSGVLTAPVTRNVLVQTIHGALASYDLPDVRALIDGDRLTIVEPIDATGAVLEK